MSTRSVADRAVLYGWRVNHENKAVCPECARMQMIQPLNERRLELTTDEVQSVLERGPSRELREKMAQFLGRGPQTLCRGRNPEEEQ